MSQFLTLLLRGLRLITLVSALLIGAGAFDLQSGAAFAQSETAQTDEAGVPRYDLWDGIAQKAETSIADPQAPLAELAQLREELVSWRETFLDRQSVNDARIVTVREQITTLGPEPADGEKESTDIAARRAELQNQLQNLTAPVRRAEEAFTQAGGIINELDSTVRERQTNKVLQLDPTPLNPANWATAPNAIAAIFGEVRREIGVNFGSSAQRQAIQNSLPLTILFAIIGFVLLTRSTGWVDRIMAAMRNRYQTAGAGLRISAFVASLLAVAIPALGMIAILTAIDQIGLDGPVGRQLLGLAILLVGVLFAARWLSRQVFPPAYPPRKILNIPDARQREARLYTVLLALLVSFSYAIDTVQLVGPLAEALNLTARSVLLFPVTLASGLILFRFAQILIVGARPVVDDDDTGIVSMFGASGRIIRFLARASLVVAVIGPILAALGYATAGSSLVNSTVQTLAVVAATAVLQRLARDLYAVFMGDEAAKEGLIPVLLGFAIAICSLPVLALIWGARVSDLKEAWTLLSNGVQLGDSRISPTDFLTFVVLFALLYSLTRLFQSTLKTQILPKTKLDTGGRNAIVAGTGYVGIFVAAVVAITSAGIDLSSLAIVAGALSVGIGFGLQTIVSNFVSGIILLIERPISEGDWIEVGGTMGVVRDISVRATRVETFDRTDVIVPNADLISGTVTNWTKGNLNGRLIIPVGVAYGTDTRKVEKILTEIAMEAPGVIVTPPPAVFFMGFGADSLDFEIRAILRDVNYIITTRSDINHEINRRFLEEGIEIPFAQRDLWLRNPEALAATSRPEPKPAPKKPANSKKAAPTQIEADDLPGATGEDR